MHRLSISLPEAVARELRRAAAEDGESLSSFVVQAIESRLLLRNARRAIADWEQEHGTITEEELKRVERSWR
jgi:hypothetical protein